MKLRKSDSAQRWKHIKLSSHQFSLAVVDRFQGLEKDIIIFDLVRTGHDNTLGFLANPNRINVALSRQKKLLFIVGDYRGILNVPTSDDKYVALQEYLRSLKREWVINHFEQLF